ncbi:MAG: hypothetical protein ABS916_05125 [Carnobacterium sp.]|uniref:hypothetical protein n=1 Tax=Carnobacterium sp. TaxID=48221 RepID=UPI003315C47E
MKNYKKIIGYILVLVAVLILVSLPNIVYPVPNEDGMDIYLYILETSLNVVRYVVLSIFSFILGIKFVFKS